VNDGDVFRPQYAACYDAFYADKDYDAECDLLEAAFARFGDGRLSTILDLGCGTGGHALRMARRGYAVTGVDRSPAMLEQARRKGGESGPEFLHGDLQTLELGRTFDAVVMMFAVLGYQTSNEELLSSLRSVSRHLRPGGVFTFDFWYGPAVLRERPSDRARVFREGSREIIRVAHGGLDVLRHLALVDYEIWVAEDGAGMTKSSERHVMRYFFPQELRLLLDTAGLEVVSLSAFGSLEPPVREGDWNAFAVARPR